MCECVAACYVRDISGLTGGPMKTCGSVKKGEALLVYVDWVLRAAGFCVVNDQNSVVQYKPSKPVSYSASAYSIVLF